MNEMLGAIRCTRSTDSGRPSAVLGLRWNYSARSHAGYGRAQSRPRAANRRRGRLVYRNDGKQGYQDPAQNCEFYLTIIAPPRVKIPVRSIECQQGVDVVTWQQLVVD